MSFCNSARTCLRIRQIRKDERWRCLLKIDAIKEAILAHFDQSEKDFSSFLSIVEGTEEATVPFLRILLWFHQQKTGAKKNRNDNKRNLFRLHYYCIQNKNNRRITKSTSLMERTITEMKTIVNHYIEFYIVYINVRKKNLNTALYSSIDSSLQCQLHLKNVNF